MLKTREVIFTLILDWSGHSQSALGTAFYKGFRGLRACLGWWGVWIPGLMRNDWINWECLDLAGMWSLFSCVWKMYHRKRFRLHVSVFLTPENRRMPIRGSYLERAFKSKCESHSQKLGSSKNGISCLLFRCLHKLGDYFEEWCRENWIIWQKFVALRPQRPFDFRGLSKWPSGFILLVVLFHIETY